MVFLFPGILFRRAFFSGNYNKHFDSGNSFERLLWNMLASILMLASFCIFLHLFNVYSPLKLHFNLKVDDITDTFMCMYENKLPTIFSSEKQIIHTANLLFSLYFFSFTIGIFLNKIVFFLGLEKRFTALQFQNRWHYLTNSTKQNNLNHSIGDIFYTKVDLKNSKDELFTGKLHDILHDKEGKVEAITIQEAYKFYKLDVKTENSKINLIKKEINEHNPQLILHAETVDLFVYRKRIKGDLFTIFNNDLENISITYIKISNFYRKFHKYLKIVFSIIMLVAAIFSLSYSIWDFQLFAFESYYKRLLFCIISPFVLGVALLTILSIFKLELFRDQKKRYFQEILHAILILTLLSIPYLYTFNIVKGFYAVLIFIVFMIVISMILPQKQKIK